ncbi:hypothetical protein [Saccharothrix sp. Mg75]|uniref:hypothetical protein n=1 Tax=Saccharothrix sp. Mg75 TaxID=3445357 RepID=UPI003EE9D25A
MTQPPPYPPHPGAPRYQVSQYPPPLFTPPPPPRGTPVWPFVLAGVLVPAVVVGLVSVVVGRSDPGTAAAATTTTRTPDPPRSTGRRAVTPTASPAPSTPPPPSSHSGTGDGAVTLDRPPGAKVVRFECPACTGNVVVRTDGFDRLLVNKIGAYAGSHWFDALGAGRTTTITVQATVAWTLTVGGLELADTATGAMGGSGDRALLFTGESRRARVTNVGNGNFVVKTVTVAGGRPDLPVNHIGAFDGAVPLEGPAMIQVESYGDWTITPS